MDSKFTDGLKGFVTSKRAIGLVVGVIASVLSAWKGIEIDPALREQLIANIWKITAVFVGGTSLSDTFGKGKVAEETRAALAGVVRTGLDVAAAVVNRDKPAAGGDGGGSSK